MYSRVMGNQSCRDGRKVVILNGLIRVGIPEKMRPDEKLKRGVSCSNREAAVGG